ncbi:hypothetical protein ACFLU6_04130 [Acidobacteriota bacterium]
MKSLTWKCLGVIIAVTLLLGCGDDNAPIVKLKYNKSEGTEFTGEVRADNLKKNSAYAFSINGKVGQDGNEQLLKHGNWGGQGYNDFEQVDTDKNGSFSASFRVPLAEGKYDVTFILKDVADEYRPIYVEDHVSFTVKKEDLTQKKKDEN